ncbi:efflux RND transporter permease subunit [Shewanella sp.]|uniref:efflux RND transporter permease subunit n=1 Tax=Shewanella sp. TaxID=50422 RepID=UPI004047ACD7
MFGTQSTHTGAIAWFARNSVAANLLLIGMIVVGLFSLNSMRKEAFPSLEPDRVTVSVTYDSGDPVLAEEGIAIKIEDALETVPGIKRITSTSNANGSSVMIEKTSSYDLDTLLTDIKTNVDAIYNFPSEAENPVIDKMRMQDHALWIEIYGNADRATLQALAEQLKSDLLSQDAIHDLEIKAKAEPMISIEVDELQAYGLTLASVASAVNAESSTSISTSLYNDDKTVRLKVSDQAYQQQDFMALPIVTTSQGSIITLGDIATVKDDFADDTFVLSRYNNANSSAIEIVMDENGDIVNIVEQASQVVEKWRNANVLPEGVNIATWHDKSTLITERLSLLVKNALSGIALVFIILALFLNLRVAFWVAAGLPFVFFGTLFFMGNSFAGLTLNEMTTFGFIMALGIVVDDAVVVGESVYSTRQKYGDTIDNTIKGTLKVATPTIFGVLTTVVAFVALANVEGRLGQIYAQFGTVVAICLMLSLVESKFILPSHLAHIDTKKRAKKSWFNHIQHAADSGLQWSSRVIYQPLIEFALRFRYAVVMVFIALFIIVAGMPITGSVRVAFFPDITGDTAVADFSMQNDASFGQTYKNLTTLEHAAKQVDAELAAQFNHNDEAKDSYLTSLHVLASSSDSGQVQVELDPNSPYTLKAFTLKWTEAVGQMEGVKKFKVLAKQEMLDNFKVEIKASDTESVFAAGQALKAAIEVMDGVSGIDNNLDLGEPQYRFELTAQGRALGFDTETLSAQVLQSFGGGVVQRFQRGKDEVKVRVRYPDEDRQTISDVKLANVRTSDGTIVPLSHVADIFNDYQPSSITRIDSQRAVYISAVLDKDKIASNELVSQLKQTLVPQLEVQYPGVSFNFAGEAEQQAETTSSIESMFVLALIAIYALLAIPLKSYVQPVIIMTAIPFGIVGAILGHWWNDLTISILSLNGILALSGVVVNDSLLLVSRFNELLKEEGLSVHDAIVESCTGRLRAVLLTSVTTFAGLAPLLGETSLQAQFLIPAAAALGYGILFATVITLILTPSLLLIQCETNEFITNIMNKLRPNHDATAPV